MTEDARELGAVGDAQPKVARAVRAAPKAAKVAAMTGDEEEEEEDEGDGVDACKVRAGRPPARCC